MTSFHDLEILARTVYGEARGESFEGQVAVARVMVNRWKAKKWFSGATIAETCQKPQQFSCWNANDPNRAKLLAADLTDPKMRQAVQAAIAALAGGGPPWIKGATHYHTTAISPTWAKDKQPAGRLGAHVFYAGID